MKALRAIDDILCAKQTAMRLPARFCLSLATLYFTVGAKSRANAFDSSRQFSRESGSRTARKANALPVAPPIQLFPHSVRSEILVKATGADVLRLQRSRTLF